MLGRFIDSGLFTLLYPVTLVIAVMLGYYVAYRYYRRKDKKWQSSGIENSVIGLFALLLSFTFLSSGNSMKDRNSLIHEGADAVSSMRRQSLFMNDTIKNEAKIYLLNFTTLQSDFNVQAKLDIEKYADDVIKLSGDFLTWLTKYAKQSPAHFQDALLIQPSFQKINTLFFKIKFSYEERTPVLIILLIIISSWLIGMLVGFMNGFHEERHYMVPLIFVLLVSLSVQAIRDLDNPKKGTIKPSFENFQHQNEMMEKSTR